MDKGNVLVIGNSGVGKSTLINAVLGKEVAKTSWGTNGTTTKLEIYESDQIPFRIIDSIGFQPSLIKETQAINAVKKWSRESTDDKNNNNHQINVIWFCVEGTSSKIFPEAIKNLSRATSMWKSVPIIVVVTKSYSELEREDNIKLVNSAFAKQKCSKNLKDVVPVVAQSYQLNSTAIAPPFGITKLIDVTNNVMPEGIKAAAADISSFKLKRKRVLAQSVVGTTVAAGAVVGAVPIPFADAIILTPLEIAEVNGIATVYGINKGEESKRLINSMVEVGTVGAVAKAIISGLKAIPGINIATSVLNAVIAGSIIAALGEGSIYAFEKIYLGEKTIDDIDWVKKILESKFSNSIIEKINKAFSNGKITNDMSAKDIGKILTDIFKPDSNN